MYYTQFLPYKQEVEHVCFTAPEAGNNAGQGMFFKNS